MKRQRILIIVVLLALGIGQMPPAHAQFGDILKGIKKAVCLDGELPESKIIEGLKEALEIGTGKAVGLVSQLDGYNKNSKIKIPLPDKVKKVEKVL